MQPVCGGVRASCRLRCVRRDASRAAERCAGGNADWTPDRGSDAQARERALTRRPALVETGRCACCPSPDALSGLHSCVHVPLLADLGDLGNQ